MGSSYIVILCFSAFLFNTAYGFNKKMFTEVYQKCVEEVKPPQKDIEAMMNKKMPVSEVGKCMLACMFKGVGIMTADGKFNQTANEKSTEKVFKNNEEKMNRAKEISAACQKKIEAVQDDEKGCNRAAEMAKCAMEKMKELGYDKHDDDDEDDDDDDDN